MLFPAWYDGSKRGIGLLSNEELASMSLGANTDPNKSIIRDYQAQQKQGMVRAKAGEA